jgi:nucleotide-binding universal stress UspA family protein
LHVDEGWKEKFVGAAATESAKLQQDAGTKAEAIIDSGNVPEPLNRAAEQTKADVLVIGHIRAQPFGGQRQWLWDHSGVANPGAERLRKSWRTNP